MDPRITERFGDAARLLGDTKVTLVEHGPFAWLETDAVLTFDVRALFLEDGRWIAVERNLAAFERILARVRPPLHDWRPIVDAHKALTFDQPLLAIDDVRDLADPRWYLTPLTDAQIAAWHAPRVANGELVWLVERFPHRAEIARVMVDASHRVRIA